MLSKRFKRTGIRQNRSKGFLKVVKNKSKASTDEQSQTDSSVSQTAFLLPYNREQVIKQLLHLGSRHLVEKQTIYLAIAYFDIYEDIDIRWYSNTGSSQKTDDSSKKFALALFSISSKFNDICNVSIEELTRCHGEEFKKCVILLEQKILEALDYEIPSETPYTIFYKYYDGNDRKLSNSCHFFEKAIIDQKLMNIDWDILSKAIVHFQSAQQWQDQDLACKMQIKTTVTLLKQLN